MNLLHLKYAVEVSRTSSITKAAEALYISQPNLSRAIHELEDTLGVALFYRTAQGVSVTPEGEEFLRYARSILAQVDAVENLYRREQVPCQKFSISVPRASYIACAFTAFTKTLDPAQHAELFYKETNSLRAIRNILQADYKLGILRYQSAYDPYFQETLRQKALAAELICEFHYVLLMAAKHPLAQRDEIHISDLEPYLEIAHADPYVPSLPAGTVQKEELSDGVQRHIFIFERGSQMDLLAETPGAFMWVSPVPQKLLDRYGLVQKRCIDNRRLYRDVLIYRQDYRFTDFDQAFLQALEQYKSKL